MTPEKEEKLKEAILKILNHYNTEIDYDHGDKGIPEDKFDDVATDILDIVRGEK